MRVTASKVGLLAYCAWWARPEAKWGRRRANHGPWDAVHKAMDRYLSAPSDQVAKEDLEEDIREEYWGRPRRGSLDDSRDSGLRPTSTRRLRSRGPPRPTRRTLDVIDRQYRPSSRLCGTADLVVRNAHGVDVYDYKTGSGADAGPQLRALGLMARAPTASRRSASLRSR